MDTSMWVVLVVLALIVGGLVVWFVMRRQRSMSLRRQFGAEYDRALHATGSTRHAEAELERRTERRRHLDIRPLHPDDRIRFAESWRLVQARFVDEPADAVGEAEVLLTEVMRARGYPVTDFEQRAADLSVDHGPFVEDYRAAHEITLRRAHGHASTEDLRQAMVHFRRMFDDLLDAQTASRQEARP